ncbi:unnamed protein product [Closterium sp. NIES-65]|nr:unnamed protein product [Closterium sp. NIES-65]
MSSAPPPPLVAPPLVAPPLPSSRLPYHRRVSPPLVAPSFPSSRLPSPRRASPPLVAPSLSSWRLPSSRPSHHMPSSVGRAPQRVLLWDKVGGGGGGDKFIYFYKGYRATPVPNLCTRPAAGAMKRGEARRVDVAYNVDEEEEEVAAEDAMREQEAWERSYANDRLLGGPCRQAASEVDMKPSRMAAMARSSEAFILNFFDSNPLSHLALLLLRDGVASQLSELTSPPDAHIKALQSNLSASGPASLQNVVEAAVEAVAHVPAYGHRELLLLFAALASTDPGDILPAIRRACAAHLRCSIIGVGGAEVHICRQIAEQTGGRYSVAMDDVRPAGLWGVTDDVSPAHLRELLMSHAPPPPVQAGSAGSAASLVRMGFPQRAPEGAAALCACHMHLRLAATYVPVLCSQTPLTPSLKAMFFLPPIPIASHLHHFLHLPSLPPPAITSSTCHHFLHLPSLPPPAITSSTCHHFLHLPSPTSRVCALPAECPVCALTLVSSPHLARSYHHLFPVPPFSEVPLPPAPKRPAGSSAPAAPHSDLPPACFSCTAALPFLETEGGGVRVECPSCARHFCFDCDVFIHESLHNCPGCEATRLPQVA